jgi:hypothetical protein
MLKAPSRPFCILHFTSRNFRLKGKPLNIFVLFSSSLDTGAEILVSTNKVLATLKENESTGWWFCPQTVEESIWIILLRARAAVDALQTARNATALERRVAGDPTAHTRLLPN